MAKQDVIANNYSWALRDHHEKIERARAEHWSTSTAEKLYGGKLGEQLIPDKARQHVSPLGGVAKMKGER